MTFRLIKPRGRAVPLVIEVPHAGTQVPNEAQATLAAETRDLLRDADLFVDELFEGVTSHGATLLCADVSRYVVDLNRFESDVDRRAVTGLEPANDNSPRGLIWCETTDGRPALRRPLTLAEFEARMTGFYHPYHRALADTLHALREEFGYAVLLAAHSMPSVGRSGHGDRGMRRADVVPGSRGRTTADASLIDTLESHFRAAGLSVRHDDPYRGGATTIRWGRPAEGLHARSSGTESRALHGRKHEPKAERQVSLVGFALRRVDPAHHRGRTRARPTRIAYRRAVRSADERVLRRHRHRPPHFEAIAAVGGLQVVHFLPCDAQDSPHRRSHVLVQPVRELDDDHGATPRSAHQSSCYGSPGLRAELSEHDLHEGEDSMRRAQGHLTK